jgi:hypothetical protein
LHSYQVKGQILVHSARPSANGEFPVMTLKIMRALFSMKECIVEAQESIQDNVDEDDIDILEHDSLKGVEPRML